MEKISGILPSSPRIMSVDLREAAAVRPGVPSFGRAEAVSSLKSRNVPETATEKTTAGISASLQREHLDWRSKEAKEANIASDMSSQFFLKNQKAADKFVKDDEGASTAISAFGVPSKPAGFKTEELDSFFLNSRRPQSTGSKLLDKSDDDSKGLGKLTSFDVKTPQFKIEDDSTFEQPDGLFPKGSFISRKI
jgi:hypothetical protein